MDEKKDKRVLSIELDEDELDQATGGTVPNPATCRCYRDSN